MSADGEDEGNEIIGNGPGIVKVGGADRLTQVNHAALPTLSTHTPPLGTVVSEADTVMSFVNLGEYICSWKLLLKGHILVFGKKVELQRFVD